METRGTTFRAPLPINWTSGHHKSAHTNPAATVSYTGRDGQQCGAQRMIPLQTELMDFKFTSTQAPLPLIIKSSVAIYNN